MMVSVDKIGDDDDYLFKHLTPRSSLKYVHVH